MPSMFIGEIPAECVQDVRPKTTMNSISYSRHEIDQNDSGFSVGQRVQHQKFGAGIVLNYEGQGSHARVEVNFDHAGSKWLVLSYANLQAI